MKSKVLFACLIFLMSVSGFWILTQRYGLCRIPLTPDVHKTTVQRKITSLSTPVDVVTVVEKTTSDNDTLIQQRIKMSRLLNKVQHKAAKLQCELLKLRKKQGYVTSDSGGWCTNSMQNHITDKKVIPALAELFKSSRVASFGDGMGVYRKKLLETQRLTSYDSYDGNPYCEEFTNGTTKFLDLTLPQYGIPTYDWVMSLEVAEHIPRQYEVQFVDNLVRHATVGIVLSWAKIGQGGYSHINNRSFDYVKRMMLLKGFKHSPEESETLKQSSSLSWLIDNVNVFRKVSS